MINGGGQERRLRAGTENTAGIVGFGKAAEILLSRRKMDAIHLESMKRVFLDGLSGLEDYIINSPCDGVPGIISVSFAGIEAEPALLRMSMAGVIDKMRWSYGSI